MGSEFETRLGAIETQWSIIRRAHLSSPTLAIDARRALVLRYSAAIRNFVSLMTTSEEEADEVAQDAILRLMKGDFAGADPQRGRFRDLLRAAVRNMVRDHWSRQNRARSRRDDRDVGLVAETTEHELEESWQILCRDNLLNAAWSRLEEYERQNQPNVSFTLLRTRADHPEWSYDQLRDFLAESRKTTVQLPALRQQLRRARVRFAEYLVEEVAHGLDPVDATRLQDELISLGLYEQVKNVLPDDWNVGPS